MALGLVLGATMEEGFKLALHLAASEESLWMFFFSRPLTLVFILLTVLSLLYSLWKEWPGTKSGKAN